MTSIIQSFNPAVKGPQSYLINGKIDITVASNNITLSLKTTSGATPSLSDLVSCRIGDTVRFISSALSVTVNAGANTFNSGAAEIATKEVDYFAYLGYNATDGVTIGFSRIIARAYGDFSSTATNEKYCAISTIANAATNDNYELIGRFAATLSAGAGYTWTVPTYTPVNLVQVPIFESRVLSWTSTFPSGFSADPGTIVNGYKVLRGRYWFYHQEGANGTGSGTTATMTMPFIALSGGPNLKFPSTVIDNSATTGGCLQIISGNNTANIFKDYASTALTTATPRRLSQCSGEIPI